MLPPLKPDAWWNALSQGLGTLSGLAGRRIAVDFANGAGQLAATWLQENVAGDWSLAETTRANINDGCGSEHLEHLSRVVREGAFDAGLALDGDGDRCRLVGPHGDPLPGDAVLWLLARDCGAERIAVTVMSNMGLEASLPNTHVLRTPVGDAHIEAALRTPGVPLGGEESGHIRFVDHPTGDGLFAGLRALDAAFRNGGLVRATEGYTPYATTQFKIAVTSRPSLTDHPVITPMVGEVERRLNGEGRIFLRYSGTEPVLRVLIEAASQRLVNALAGEVRAVLKKVYE
jgi:phosphoglucosamine mutase